MDKKIKTIEEMDEDIQKLWQELAVQYDAIKDVNKQLFLVLKAMSVMTQKDDTKIIKP